MPRAVRLTIHAALLALTLLTSSAAGARLLANFHANRPAFTVTGDLLEFLFPFLGSDGLLAGLPFALTLVGILLAHELGHYLACVHYRLDASLPYFLPAPGFVGTFGAFIRIRSAVYSRRVLFDVGIAGPIAGFVVLIPVLLVGLAMSKQLPGIAHRGDIVFGTPLLLSWLESVYFPGVPQADIYLHPIARAAWVGLFATALNLLPIGQLDGGHLVYALAGERHRLLSTIALGALIPLGFLYWPWWLWAAGLFLFGRRHPYIYDRQPIGWLRRSLAAVAALLFLLSFMPAPVHT